MKFIDILIQNSQIKEAKLYGPSKKAMERPETGVTIQTPAAFHVIKDCATLANKYLPHFIFGHYANPFEVLKGKFTKTDIAEFVDNANSDIILFQLLSLILDKATKVTSISTSTITSNTSYTSSANDPYGDYDSYTAATQLTQQQDVTSILCNAFDVTQ